MKSAAISGTIALPYIRLSSAQRSPLPAWRATLAADLEDASGNSEAA
jgi:hypothetical protein